MGIVPSPPPFSDIDTLLHHAHPTYGFATEEWVDSPPFIVADWVDPAIPCQRLGHADAYRQHGSPVSWHRYVVLGFYVFEDCSHFDRYWRQFTTKRLMCSQMIWYNYMYHVDRKLNIHPKLQSWAQDVVRPHLAVYDRGFLLSIPHACPGARLYLPRSWKMSMTTPNPLLPFQTERKTRKSSLP